MAEGDSAAENMARYPFTKFVGTLADLLTVKVSPEVFVTRRVRKECDQLQAYRTFASEIENNSNLNLQNF